MNTHHSRFWIVALGLTLIMSQSLAQVDQPGRFRIGRGAGVTEATFTPLVRQTLRQSALRFVPQGVRRMVTQDYATIQAAIDASNDGDTVLVSEGTYMENIRYRGKAIVVGSLYLLDNDTTHIAKTIIDGSSSTQADSGSVVYFINEEDTTSVLCGFTIQGGSGTRYYYGGLWLTAWLRAGGGIFCDGAGARVVHNNITRNRVVAEVAFGGGIVAYPRSSFLPYLILEANRITDNCAEGSYDKAAFNQGGGADIEMNARIVGNVFERDTVLGRRAVYGGAISFCALYTTLLDGYIAGNVFRSNFAYTRLATAEGSGAFSGGLYVGGTGNVTIQDNLFESNRAMADRGNHQGARGGGLWIDDEGYTGYGRKTIVHNKFINNTINAGAYTLGGGLALSYTLATVSENKFANNATEMAHEVDAGGAAVGSWHSSFRLENNIISGNVSSQDGGALLIKDVSPIGKEQAIINNTLVDNHSPGGGDGLRADGAEYLVLLNNILWDDTSSGGVEISLLSPIAGVAYCDVKGGYPGTGNISLDPAFVEGDAMFHLTSRSPCIESGVESVQFWSTRYAAPVNDYAVLARPMPAGTPPDMGAQEEQVTAVAYAHDLSVQPLAPIKQLDTVQIRATVENPQHHALSVIAFTRDFASGYLQDSIFLYNDGFHGDGLPDDTLWGGRFVPTSIGVYGVSIRTVDGDAGTSRESPVNMPSFATAGPVRYAGYRYWGSAVDTIPAPGVDLYVRIGLKNTGGNGLITNVTARIAAVDTLVDYASTHAIAYGTLYPVDTICFSTNVAILSLGYDRATGDTASFAVSIYSNGGQLWRDTMRIVLPRLIPGVNEEKNGLPTSYGLEQNYPNPFNPRTVVSSQLPVASNVKLIVYDVLGREVAVLVNERRPAGSYQDTFDASGLASGIYLYRMMAGNFVQTKKLVILK
jgi:hypothetical protein